LKTLDYTDELVSREVLERITEFTTFESENFVDQARFFGMNPAEDFRGADLTDVDFSDCDLSPFDFSGADLRGATGINVVGSPVLVGAETKDSLFEYQLQQEAFFKENPDLEDTVERVSSDYWANAVLRVESLLQGYRDLGAGMKIVSAIFDKTKDPTIRTNILLFMKISSESSTEHKIFIGNMLSKYSNNVSITLSGIRALSAFYSGHRDAFNWLVRFMTHENALVRSAAFKGVVRSARFKDAIGPALKYVQTTTEHAQRRAFVGHIAGLIGPAYQRAVFDFRAKRYFDLGEEITPDMIRSWSEDDFRDFLYRNDKLKRAAAEKVFEMRRIYRIGKVARNFGFSFKFAKAVTARIDQNISGE
jgi:hypothetical protein